jgi:hypothetical protein
MIATDSSNLRYDYDPTKIESYYRLKYPQSPDCNDGDTSLPRNKGVNKVTSITVDPRWLSEQAQGALTKHSPQQMTPLTPLNVGVSMGMCPLSPFMSVSLVTDNPKNPSIPLGSFYYTPVPYVEYSPDGLSRVEDFSRGSGTISLGSFAGVPITAPIGSPWVEDAKTMESVAEAIASKAKLSIEVASLGAVGWQAESLDVALSNCHRYYGNGYKRITFARGRSVYEDSQGRPVTRKLHVRTIPEFLSFIGEIKEYGRNPAPGKEAKLNEFFTIMPHRIYNQNFSIFIDLSLINDVKQSVLNAEIFSSDAALSGASSCQDTVVALLTADTRLQPSVSYATKLGSLAVINMNDSYSSYALTHPNEYQSLRRHDLARTVHHELGHSIAGLDDEYLVPGAQDRVPANTVITGLNCTTNISQFQYGDVTYASSPIPEGCNKYRTGVYRPTEYSLMGNPTLTVEGTRFNVVSCGYLSTRISGQGGKANTYFPRCKGWMANG